MDNKKVLLGMSGGVDSAVSAILLKEQGYEVVGVTLELYENKALPLRGEEFYSKGSPAADAKKVCDFLGIEHHVMSFKEAFKKHVIDNFICEYKNCRTPNPCIQCNKFLKFGVMYEKAKELGCEYIATGHYAKTEYSDKYGCTVLTKSNAGKKDQSYVLYNLPKDMVDKVLFPLGEFQDKSEIRAIAEKYNLPVAKKPDSEDICFIPDGDYKKFLEENSDIKSKEGNIVDKTGKVLGKHSGLYKHTIGQRKGLGISNPVPLFVVGFDVIKNELIVGEEAELYTKEFEVENYNLILIDETDLEKGVDCEIKIRYAAQPANGKILKIDSKIKVVFDEPQKSVTPGQSAVFYDGEILIGGGIIK
ncbi:MAG: tRNA 2-thiouridine(34) synthase MnmA [Clostridia bacterium]|nr:tRNA 2-thiouridine(34) synthase MnmA [Clostridia bacterium]